jgi:hypothetical protein
MLPLQGRFRRFVSVIILTSLLSTLNSWAEDENPTESPHKPTVKGVAEAQRQKCEAGLEDPNAGDPPIVRAKRVKGRRRASSNEIPVVAPAKAEGWTLSSFFEADPERNLAIKHPFSIANAAEKAYALIMHEPPRDALDPLYRVSPVKIYPMLSGEHPATEGRMVVGQEEAVAAFVSTLHSIARGDRSGMTLGFPGPAGTGKTELLYVLANLEKNLGREDKYKQFSYRWRGLENIPYLRPLVPMRNGAQSVEYFDPDLPRSPFTLLRHDMQKRILDSSRGPIRTRHGVLISEGWGNPEPKSAEIIRRIFEHHFPKIADGKLSVEDLSEQQYIETLSQYVVIVPKRLLRPVRVEPDIIRAQTENPNYQALVVSPNVIRAHHFPNGYQNPLSVDYTGKIVQLDGGLLMMDELFRNPGEFLNLLLEVIQNHVIETEYGPPIKLDIVPIWNANDESIERAKEDGAIKALINRTDSPPMRSLLAPNQIESVVPFLIGMRQFKMRRLDETETRPFVHSEVYPAPNAYGQTFSAQGRYALYYDMDGKDVLISPYALNYMAWLAAATRFVVEPERFKPFAGEVNLVRSNASILFNPVDRVLTALGDKIPERADRMELARVRMLLHEGERGIGFRDMETWFKEVLTYSWNRGKAPITPLLVDQVFQALFDQGRIKVEKNDIRARWQLYRQLIKTEVLLPRLSAQIKEIVSGDGSKVTRIYDEIEQELIAKAENREVMEVTPEDGSQPLLINEERLKEIQDIYRAKFKKEFEPGFLLRQLSGARRGQNVTRDPNLMEAIRIFLADVDSKTVDYISAMDSFYRGDNSDPEIRKRASEIDPLLGRYGYDEQSFKQALSFVAQLVREERRAREAKIK